MNGLIPGQVYPLTPQLYVEVSRLRQRSLMAAADECRVCGNSPDLTPN